MEIATQRQAGRFWSTAPATKREDLPGLGYTGLAPMVDTAIVTALIGSGASLALAGFGAWRAVRLERMRAIDQREMQTLRDVIDARKGVRDSRRAYEFDGRRRLYEELEPVLFQSQDAARQLFDRVANMARVARDGHLGSHGAAWLAKGTTGYYRHSTLYRLMRIWALHQIALRRLTQVDQRLDIGIARRIQVQSVLYELLSDHFRLARAGTPIPYRPYEADGGLQGIFLGDIDKAGALLLERPDGGPERILDFGAFEDRLKAGEDARIASVGTLSSRFDDFHPASHAVLWRALVASASLAWILACQAERDEADPEKLVQAFYDDPRAAHKFDWRGADGATLSSIDTPEGTLRAAHAHLLDRFRSTDLLD
jgi:hypothetical protein